MDVTLGHDLAEWAHSCEKCVCRYHEATTQLEQEATMVLAKDVPTLTSVSWASFCSIGRTKWSTHHIVREERGQPQVMMLTAIHSRQKVGALCYSVGITSQLTSIVSAACPGKIGIASQG